MVNFPLPSSWTILAAAKGYLGFLAGDTSPLFASYNVTYRCNLRCEFCYAWRSDYPELDDIGARRIVREICSSGVLALDFSGGEPFLRRDLEALGSLTKALGCLSGVNTNGTLIDADRASRTAISFDYVTVSIDGTEDVHDRIRGVRGTYRRARAAMEALKDNGTRVGISSVVTTKNTASLLKAWRELDGLYDYLVIQPVMPPPGRAPGAAELVKGAKSLAASGIEVLPPPEFLEGIPAYLKGRAPKICDAIKLYFAVGPMGEVLACGARNDIVLGNILEKPIREILSKPPRDALEKIRICKGCWTACTVGVSLAIRRPFGYLLWLARNSLRARPLQATSPRTS